MTGSAMEYKPNNQQPINEEFPIGPTSLYGAAKASSTIIGMVYGKAIDLDVVVLRPFGVFGEYEGLHKIIPRMIKAVIYKETINLTKGEQIRDYIYVKDLVNALIKFIEIKEFPSFEVFNVCSNIGISIKEIATRILEISGAPSYCFNFGAVPYRKDEVMYLVGDNSKIRSVLQWEPKYSLEEGLSRTYKWYKRFLEVYNA